MQAGLIASHITIRNPGSQSEDVAPHDMKIYTMYTPSKHFQHLKIMLLKQMERDSFKRKKLLEVS